MLVKRVNLLLKLIGMVLVLVYLFMFLFKVYGL